MLEANSLFVHCQKWERTLRNQRPLGLITTAMSIVTMFQNVMYIKRASYLIIQTRKKAYNTENNIGPSRTGSSIYFRNNYTYIVCIS